MARSNGTLPVLLAIDRIVNRRIETVARVIVEVDVHLRAGIVTPALEPKCGSFGWRHHDPSSDAI